jgi:hypothetical protein
MKLYGRIGNKVRLLYPAVILLLSLSFLALPGLALMAIPDIGIDFKTMKVVQAEKLIAAGMKNVNNGDSISMRSSPKEGKIVLKNLRTGEEFSYPPDEQKRKEK